MKGTLVFSWYFKATERPKPWVKIKKPLWAFQIGPFAFMWYRVGHIGDYFANIHEILNKPEWSEDAPEEKP